jgi:hypothetical protein
MMRNSGVKNVSGVAVKHDSYSIDETTIRQRYGTISGPVHIETVYYSGDLGW